MLKDWEQLKEFLITTFLFINKETIERTTTWNLNQTEYFILMIGVWIVIIFLIWLTLWLTFKIIGYFKQ